MQMFSRNGNNIIMYTRRAHGKGMLNEPKDGARTSGGPERRPETARADLAHLRVHYTGLLIRDRSREHNKYIHTYTQGRPARVPG